MSTATLESTLERTTCAACGQEIDTDDAHDCGGATYCRDCVIFCHCCDSAVPLDDARTSADGDSYCESCYDDTFTTCEHCHCEISRDDANSNEDGNDYCSDCYHDLYATCEHCGCEVTRDESPCSDNGEYYCDSCYSDRYTTCDACDCELSRDDAVYVRDGVYCESCASEQSDGENWDAGPFRPGLSCREVGSHRQFGVELETSACPDYSELEGDTVFGAKDDGSISGKEFVSPILSSDAGLDAIRDFCRRANYMGFKVDGSCGFHAHFDVRDLSVAQLKAVAYAYHKTYAAWAAFVPPSRRENHYCAAAGWGKADLAVIHDQDAWRAFAGSQDRYVWINLRAFAEHGSFEVRLHTATLDGEKVCNWIKAHTRFIDTVRNMTFREIDAWFGDSAESAFAGLAEVWHDRELTAFYAGRAGQFGRELAPVTVHELVAA